MGFDEDDVDQSWESWRDLFLITVESFIPKIKLKDAKSPKWIDSEIIKLSKQKNRLWKRAKQSNSPMLWDNYRAKRKQIKTATKRKYRDFLMNMQTNLKVDPKKFWSFYAAKTKSARIPKVVCFGDQKASTPAAKANLFNRFFASVFQKPNLHSTTINTQAVAGNELHLIQTSIEEVTKELKAINPSKAHGPDQIPGRLLTECASEIAPSLMRLINLSLRVGCVPKDWKCANIVPVLKKANKEDVTNYRPISLLNLVSKIAERCVFAQFYSFIAANIHPLQHGFVKGRSTVTQLLDTVHRVTSAIDQGVQTDVAFLDFSKAFDSVSHPHLISKLDQFGIKGPLLQWFTSYLDNRVQRVVIDGKNSEWLPVTSGVPQGSLLGPALFVLFINDMPRAVSHCSTLALFADDAKCFRTIRSASDCALFQGDINNLVEWSDVWKMTFNMDKCSLCTITRKRNPIIYDYNMRGKALKRVEAQRDLGVLVTCDARFNEHIYAQVNQANKMLGFIRRTLGSRSDQFLPTFRSLYVALVRSHLEYASEIWSPKSLTLIKHIESVQRRATRLLLPNLTYNERLQQLNLLPLVYRREVRDLTTFYKLKCGLYNYSTERYFNFCSDKRLRSYSSNKLKINKVRTELFKGTFFNRLPYLWNNLPERLRTSNFSLSLFKKHCNDFYKTMSFDPDHPHVTWMM